MPRMTAELIAAAPAYINPLHEREINLRGYKIPAIENLGVTEDEYDVIDLSDNDLVKLDNFPLLAQLHTLILNNNRINRIAATIATSLPNLTHLILTNNAIASHTALAPLHHLPHLSNLSLRLCPITRVHEYRLLVLHVLPKLRVLDYQKVKERERKDSRDRYGVWVEKKEEGDVVVAKDVLVNGAVVVGKDVQMDVGGMAERMKQLIASIESATSLDEITALEQQLAMLSAQQRNAMQTYEG